MKWNKAKQNQSDSDYPGCAGPLGCEDRKHDLNDKKCTVDCAEAYAEAMNQPVNPNNCKHDPTTMKGQPIGMYHCPECGDMVLAGCSHP